MDLKELAKALGLPEDATQEEVNAKMLAMLKEMMEAKKTDEEKRKAAETQTAAVATGLAQHGLKLSAGKIVKDEQLGSGPQAGDTPEMKKLRAEVAANRLELAKGKIGAAKVLVQQFTKDLEIPPAQSEALSRLFSVCDGAQALSLSADGQSLESSAFDLVEDLKTVLSSLPKPMQGKGITRLGAEATGEKKEKALQLSAAQQIARRATGRKEPAATK